ncbi:MAG: ADOP family duplicated permease [Acidobacteriota bacterium]|nr:ADOP family duplicated permease [Acidobacteriota bacterium]
MLADLRYGCRSLLRSPGFTAANVLTLGVGTGATIAVLALLDAVLLRPLPLEDPDRTVTLQRHFEDGVSRGFVYPEFERIREASGELFEGVAGSGVRGARVTTPAGARVVSAGFVTEGFFEVVGARPVLGRGFASSEHRVGADPVVVLTDAFWRSRLGADPSVLGARVRTGDRDATVVGVLPRGFRGLDLTRPADLFLPLRAAPLVLPPANYLADSVIMIDGLGFSPESWISITGKLRPGVSAARAEAGLTALAAPRSAAEESEAVALVTTASAALPFRSRAETERFVGLLVAVVGLVLLVGCANLAGLMLARNEHRRGEAAIRVALGVSRFRLLRLFLTETFLLAGSGSLAGLLVSVWLLQVVGRFVLPGGVSIGALDFEWSGSLVACGLVAAVATALLCGLMPALQILRIEALPVLQGHPMGGRAGAGRGRAVLLAGQVAMTLVLVIGAALFVRSLRAAVTTDVGVDVDRIFYASVNFSTSRYEGARVASFYESLVARMGAVPGVERVTFGGLPLVRNSLGVRQVDVRGDTQHLPRMAHVFFCGPEYLPTVGLALRSGRDIGERDVAGAQPVALVNESLARQLWPGRSPLGERFTSMPLQDVQVVGVVSDGKYRGFREVGGFAIYLPWAQNRELASFNGTIIGRASRDAGSLVSLLQRETRAFDPGVPILGASTLEHRVLTLAMPQQMGASLLSGLGGLALVLAIMGVYGSVAYAVTRRTREVGIRIALGASSAAIVGTVLSRTLLHAGVGTAAGVGATFALTGLVEQFLFGVAPRDPATFVAVTGTIVLAILLAGLVPALRAARIAPAVALGEE